MRLNNAACNTLTVDGPVAREYMRGYAPPIAAVYRRSAKDLMPLIAAPFGLDIA
jgi:hypothetical protein